MLDLTTQEWEVRLNDELSTYADEAETSACVYEAFVRRACAESLNENFMNIE